MMGEKPRKNDTPKAGMLRLCAGMAIVAAMAAAAERPDPSYPLLETAYAALRARQYDAAIQAFRGALAASPGRPAVHKDLAYTYLKAGETVLARDEFAIAMELDPADTHVALEYAFLCYETNERILARKTFDRLRRAGNPAAATAFENIDRPLRDGIARWRRAVELAPDNFSNHEELAKLAEERDELALAAEHYEAAWKLRPDLRYLLLNAGRVWKAQGRPADAMSALLAASRGAEPRTAESARELLPPRYPYVYEFRAAIALDPGNIELRRELAYLLLAMNEKRDAETEFAGIVEKTPADLLSTAQLGFLHLQRGDVDGARPLLQRVLDGGDDELADRVRQALKLPQALRRREEVPRAQVSKEARVLAERSLEKGYLKDALKYLKVAHENDPLDFSILLKLGWTNNLLHDDNEAVHWFRLAAKSPDAKVAAEADRAYRNLAPGLARVRTTVWTFPFYSSRWKNTFSYGQAKVEWKIPGLPVKPYLSVRFIGDVRGRAQVNAALGPQYLSESSFIVGLGVSTPVWKGITAWAEAGEAIRYVDRSDVGRMVPDYRGGIAWARGWGRGIASESAGLFFETNADGVFVSRFNNDLLVYAQTRTGLTLPRFAALRSQVYWNLNATGDAQRQPWANFTEQGPGVRFRFAWMPPALMLSLNGVRGQYSVVEGNPYPRVFHDFRAGLWYAFTR